MRLTFLGTRANIPESSPAHLKHSALFVEHEGKRLMVDCGRDWEGRWQALCPEAILLTHSHDDHIGGLLQGASCPVFATRETWSQWPSAETPSKAPLEPGQTLVFGSLCVTPFPVFHSLRSPAVGLLLETERRKACYAPDIAGLTAFQNPLPGSRLYIGDGSAFGDERWRLEAGVPCGHAGIVTQLDWCAAAKVPQAIFTHCGSEILADENLAAERLAELAGSRGIAAGFASDGWVVELRAGPDR